MSGAQSNYQFSSVGPSVSSALSDTVIDDLKNFGLEDEEINAIKSLSVDLESPVENAGSLTDYVGGSPYVDIARLSEIIKKYKPNSRDESFKDYCARVMELMSPRRSSALATIAGPKPQSNEDDNFTRSLKNLLFACGFLTMSAEVKQAAREWVRECVEFMKKHPEFNKDGIFKWPESAVTCPLGIEESAARNYIGYLDTPRFKANVGFMRAMFMRGRPAIASQKVISSSSTPTVARSIK